MKNPHFTLSCYSFAAFTFLAANSGEAQVIYTNVDPDSLIEADDDVCLAGFAEFDIDGNGINDFRLAAGERNSSTVSSASVKIQAIGADAEIMGYDYGTWFLGRFASYLAPGDPISDGNTFLATGVLRSWIDSTWRSETYGFWPINSEGYLGIRLFVGGDTLYGWIRMHVNNTSSMVVLDYALQTTPNIPIKAGEGLLCISPGNLKSQELTPSSFDLSWDPVAAAAGYQFLARKVGLPGFVKSFTGANLLSKTGLAPGQYEWIVRAKCLDGSITNFSTIDDFTVTALSPELEEASTTSFNANWRSGNLTIDYVPNSDIISINVVDLLGREIFSDDLSVLKNEAFSWQLSLPQVSSGVLIVEINDASSRLIEKVYVSQ